MREFLKMCYQIIWKKRSMNSWEFDYLTDPRLALLVYALLVVQQHLHCLHILLVDGV